MKREKPIQYFSEEYLEDCRKMSTEQILEFMESFRLLQACAPARTRTMSMRVPEPLLAAFKAKAGLRGVPYQTQVKDLMRAWVEDGTGRAPSRGRRKKRGDGGGKPRSKKQ